MKQPIEDLFKEYEGDLEAMSLLAYLGSFIKDNSAHVLSLRNIEKKTGFGRRKLRSILERLSKNKALRYEVLKCGTRVVLNSTKACSFNTTYLCSSNTIKGGSTQPFGINERSRIDLTQNLRFVESASDQSTSDMNRYEVIHTHKFSSSLLENILAPSSSLPEENKPQASTEASSLPAKRSLVRDSLTKIPRKEKKASKTKEKSLGAKIWDAYVDEYKMVYSISPPSNATNYSVTKQLGQRLGVDAMEVVRFYVHHKDAYYVKNRHDIRYVLHGANRLYIDWKKGTGITTSDAKLIESRDRNKKIFEKIETPIENELGNMSLID